MSETDTVQGPRESDYYASPGLSNSGMSDLAVSPLRYWHLHINPNRPPDEPTPQMIFGRALHCALFEPQRFEAEYAPKLDLSACDGVLETVADIKEWMLARGAKAKGIKADIIKQAVAIDPEVLIYDVLKSEHAEKHNGKTLLPIEAWNRIVGCIEALRAEPVINEILNDPDGRPEVPMRATDPGTGVPLKSRMDWVIPSLTFDLKTFVQKRGKSIDKSVVDAIYYEDYLRQAWFYTYIRTLLEPGSPEKPFVIGLVESEPPHEVRVRVLRGTTAGEPNIYWHRARTQVIGIGGRGGLVDLYADCVKRFGDKPWRTEATMDPLIDDEMPQLAFER